MSQISLDLMVIEYISFVSVICTIPKESIVIHEENLKSDKRIQNTCIYTAPIAHHCGSTRMLCPSSIETSGVWRK